MRYRDGDDLEAIQPAGSGGKRRVLLFALLVVGAYILWPGQQALAAPLTGNTLILLGGSLLLAFAALQALRGRFEEPAE